MSALPVIAVFDIGKTNKKIFLFDEQYKIVFEESTQFEETVDDDEFPCEDINKLTWWIHETFVRITGMQNFIVKAINFTAYGASFVHLDENNEPFLPLYNYLKPYPPLLQEQFYRAYGGEKKVALETASPVLGNLNSGLQLYYLKHHRPQMFAGIKWSLHLPQYLSFIISKKACSEITSIGCHTLLWNFSNNVYHAWLKNEGIEKLLPPVCNEDDVVNIPFGTEQIAIGIGLHDSSAALIPYLISFTDPFVLISTGTWCISLNPFNDFPLTNAELKEDCLCYLAYNGDPVKASRLFAGNEHEQQVKLLSEHFKKPLNYFTAVEYDRDTIQFLDAGSHFLPTQKSDNTVHASAFSDRDLSLYANYEQAYHQLMYDIVVQQKKSTQLVIQGAGVRRIFVDGGFSKNSVYMFLLAAAFSEMEVYAASVAQASAIGAALVIHKHWNKKSLPGNIIDLKYYSSSSISI
ncbi:MAG: FGGY family carbohydrate kinase [Ginsengibacter sp.]